MLAVRLTALGYVVLCLSFAGCGGDDGPGDRDTGPGDEDAGEEIDGGVEGDAGPFTCASDADCDDGLYCNGEETCDPASDRAGPDGCVPPETARDCDDGVTCTTDSCDETARNCRHTAPDIDGDGHGDVACVDGGGTPIGDDCDDADARSYPGNEEVCDGHDDDCNPDTVGFLDADGDGSASSACCNGAVCGGDCNDADNTVRPGVADGPVMACDGVDNDCDTSADEGCVCSEGTSVPCGSTAELMMIGTCRPGMQFCIGGMMGTCTGSVPPAEERCDTLDNDCDSMVDEGVTRIYYVDGDDDGFGTPDAMTTPATRACSAPIGYAPNPDDCDDTLAGVSPAGTEVCNGRDDDCSGLPDEGLRNTYYRDMDGDRYGDTAMAMDACTRPMGYADDGGDCNDAAAGVHPGVTDLCNGIDDDCNGAVDPGCMCTDGMTRMCGATDVGECAYGTQRCVSGAWAECVGVVAPATETCNAADDDCDGMTDEMVRNTYYRDADGDGFGTNVAGMTMAACSLPMGYSVLNTDCADSDGARNPAAFERCNTVDDDCDGTTDEGCMCTDGSSRPCGRPTVGICRDGTQLCVGGVYGTCTGDVPPGTETCNGLDDDCDGTTDEMTTVMCYADSDSDGYGTGTVVGRCPDSTRGAFGNCPSGYSNVAGDCNDANSAISPMDAEVCNGVDDNCAGGIDEGLTVPGCYADADSDTYGTGAASTQCRDATRMAAGFCPVGFYNRAMDCNDTRAATNPGAMETCNAIDDDCDTMVDDGVRTTFYRDADGDGFGTTATTMPACSAPTGFVVLGTDCADSDASRNPAATERCDGTLDDDCDGSVDEMCTCTNGATRSCGTSMVGACRLGSQLCSSGMWGTCSGNIEPSAEVCNGSDDDCDSTTDEMLTISCYVDGDSDGDGAGAATPRCPDTSRPLFGNCPSGYTNDAGDCNDANMSIRPGATEVCNGTDDDCDSMTDEMLTATGCFPDADSDGYGRGTMGVTLCRDASRGTFGFCPVGYTNNMTDCNDTDAAVSPADTEVCNGIDDDCDTMSDEALRVPCYPDGDSDGNGAMGAMLTQQCRDASRGTFGFCPVGYDSDNLDCNDTRADVRPGAAEVCDGTDNDCDGMTDEAGGPTWYRDADGDFYGTPSSTMVRCTQPPGYEDNDDDCNDANPLVNPAAAERCNSMNDDCDAMTDEPPASLDCAATYPYPGVVFQCAAGACSILSCPTGSADCNTMVADGCEINTTSDAANCGMCGRQCSMACVASACNDPTAIAVGGDHTCARLTNGEILCWGNGNVGQLGNSGYSSSFTPDEVFGIDDATVVSASVGTQPASHTCAVRSTGVGSGDVWCWGANTYGQLGNGNSVGPRIEPVPAVTSAGWVWTQVSAGGEHTCGIRTEGAFTGQVACWGVNDMEQIGPTTIFDPGGPPSFKSSSANVPITNATRIGTGLKHSCALLSDGTVRCWGSDRFGQLGGGLVHGVCTEYNGGVAGGAFECSETPVIVSGLAGATALAVGTNHACAVRSGGQVWCWGRGTSGQLGNGAAADSGVPVMVSGIATATSVSAGASHSCARLSSGQVMCWGSDSVGSLGDGGALPGPSPVSTPVMAMLPDATFLASGGASSCAIRSGMAPPSRDVCWGNNASGQLGDGTIVNRSSPVPVLAP